MHIFVFLSILWVSCYDDDYAYIMYEICMHDYMMMHDAIYFLYVMIDVPLHNVIGHLVCYTIETSGNMHEWNGFKISNQVSSAQEHSKEARIVYPVVVIQIGDKQLGV